MRSGVMCSDELAISTWLWRDSSIGSLVLSCGQFLSNRDMDFRKACKLRIGRRKIRGYLGERASVHADCEFAGFVRMRKTVCVTLCAGN